MKFTDGNWLMLPGVTAQWPAAAYDVEVGDDWIVIHAPTRHVNNRGATVDGALLAVKLFSPMPEVIGVRIYHHTGAQSRGPRFELSSDAVDAPGNHLEIINTGQEAGLRSGRLKAVVNKGSQFSLQFSAVPIWSQPANRAALIWKWRSRLLYPRTAAAGCGRVRIRTG